jgi:hypothetical protein
MIFDSLVKTEQTLKSKWVNYYLTLNGKYFKLTNKTAMEIFESFNLVESSKKSKDGLTTTFYYQKN